MINIHSAKARLMSLTDIGADTRALSALNEGRYGNKTVKMRSGRDYEKYKREMLGQAVTLLQHSQNNLSHTYLRDVFSEGSN